MEDLKWSPVLEYLGGKPDLGGVMVVIGNVLSPHMEDIMNPSKHHFNDMINEHHYVLTSSISSQRLDDDK